MSARQEEIVKGSGARRRAALSCVLAVFLITNAACFSDEKGETFYGRVPDRPRPELRWSDGGLPRVLDPALAAAAPDTDAVRALFDGLTELDPRTLAAQPALAERWRSSEGDRVWTFRLRSGARWSNGDAVTADDFVRSWRRAVELGRRAPHHELLANIRAATVPAAPATPSDSATRNAGVVTPTDTSGETTPLSPPPNAAATPTPEPQNPANKSATPVGGGNSAANSGSAIERAAPNEERRARTEHVASTEAFGAEALAPDLLRVRLVEPDPDFPALVAHTAFRPLHAADLPAAGAATFDRETPITSGAFRLASRSASEVVLERSPDYWDAASVRLERVRFILAPDTEAKLAMYRAGEIDVVGNAAFEPLAIKLLAPHEDFRRAAFGALNYYVFNSAVAPFGDLRVREAFALAIDRERLARDTLGGASEPANTFLPSFAATPPQASAPLVGQRQDADAAETPAPLRFDRRRARQLLAEAGYPGGRNFPVVRLLVNRNDTQRLVANFAAAAWRDALGVTTEIVVKDKDEFDLALTSGDYTIARRNHVMQTPDERRNIAALFDPPAAALPGDPATPNDDPADAPAANLAAPAAPPAAQRADLPSGDPDHAGTPEATAMTAEREPNVRVATHAEALRELPGIPLYFAAAHTLVKPYILGFDTNVFDAPSLKRVRIDRAWVPAGEPKVISVESR